MTSNYLGSSRLSRSARSTTDIRDQHRESLKTQRCESRFARMLKNRGLLLESDEDNSEFISESHEAFIYQPDSYDWNQVDVEGYPLTDQDVPDSASQSTFESYHDESEMSKTHEDVDSCGSDDWDPSSWFTGVHRLQRPCNTPSPSLSTESGSSHGSLASTPLPLPRRNRPPRSRHESLLLRKRVAETYKNHEFLRIQFEELKLFICSNSAKSDLLTTTITTRWETISEAILHRDDDIVFSALNLTNDIISARLIKPEDLLLILQQGFLLTLKESIVRSGNHQVQVIKLILAIIRHEPCATPYIIQLLSNCGLMETFSELFLMGSFEDTQMLAQFYSEVFQILCGFVTSENFTPAVPSSILASHCLRKLSELYDPILTLKLILQPATIAPILNWVFKQIGFIECKTFRSSLILVANFIRFVTFYLQNVSSDAEWARSMIETFEQGHIEKLIMSSISSGNIDQYPASLKVELEQFRDFYRCWKDEISHHLSSC